MVIRLKQSPKLIALGLTATMAITSCTNAGLVPIEEQLLLERQHIIAEVCAPPPAAAHLPYKVLFVIDTSLSNAWNDPTGLREMAVRNAIQEHIAEETVSFGIITFSDEPRRQTFGFTRDLAVLDGATENVGTSQGGTNYSDTLWTVIDFINDDIATTSLVESSRTHYVVFWLSDGFPTVGVTDTGALLPAVSYLESLAATRVAEVQFNTAFLGAGGETDAAEVQAASNLLREMAHQGSGSFSSIPAGELFEFSVDRHQTADSFEIAYAVAVNRHVRLGQTHPQVDSDGDGLTDDLERELDLDPSCDDSDGDGLRDGVEVAIRGAHDPLLHDSECEDPSLDSDGDLLSDCEERALGSLPNNPDSDGDHLLDAMELRAGTSPLEADAVLDDDLDNFSNQDELRFHLDPDVPHNAEQVTEWAYRYAVEERASTCATCGEEPPCYRLEVDNLTMLQTLETATHPRGGNVIDVVVAFRSSTALMYVRAELRGRVLVAEEMWDPPHGRFVLTPEDFGEPLQAAARR